MTEENTNLEGTTPDFPVVPDLDAFRQEINDTITGGVGRVAKQNKDLSAKLAALETQLSQVVDLLGQQTVATPPESSQEQSQETPPGTAEDNRIAAQLQAFQAQQRQAQLELQQLKASQEEWRAKAEQAEQQRMESEAIASFINATKDVLNNPSQTLLALKNDGARLKNGQYVFTRTDQYGEPLEVPVTQALDDILKTEAYAWHRKPLTGGQGTGSSPSMGGAPRTSSSVFDSDNGAVRELVRQGGLDALISELNKAAK